MRNKVKQIVQMDISAIDEKNRTVECVGSAEIEDHHGDTVRIAGIDTSAYELNPVLLWAHDYTRPPIGQALEVVKDLEQKKLRFKLQYDTAPFADEVFQLVKKGILRAYSIGFKEKKVIPKPEVDEWGFPTGFIVEECILLEISNVPVPANYLSLVGKSLEGKSLTDLAIEYRLQTEQQRMKGLLEEQTTKPSILVDAGLKAVIESIEKNFEKLNQTLEGFIGKTKQAEGNDETDRENKEEDNKPQETDTGTKGEGNEPQETPVDSSKTNDEETEVQKDDKPEEQEEPKTEDNPEGNEDDVEEVEVSEELINQLVALGLSDEEVEKILLELDEESIKQLLEEGFTREEFLKYLEEAASEE